MKQRIYLDYGAATPVDKRVLAAMQPYFSGVFYNPSALYEGAREAKVAVESAREKTAGLLGAKPSEIIFTAGGTESTNLAIQGVMSQYPDGDLVVSAIEHEAVIKPGESYNYQLAPVDEKGRVIVDELEKCITEKTVLVSVMLANNEVGTVQPIKEIAEVISKIRKSRKATKNTMPLYFHTDACQAPMYLDINVARLGVDLMTLNGGKIYGPKQSGILYKKAGVVVEPQIKGGGQEFGIRNGTENVAFAVGFTRALELAEKSRATRARETTELRNYFISELENRYDATISGHKTHRIANNIHAVFAGVDNERALFALDDAGVDAAAGSACSASSEDASHVLLAMGMTEDDSRSSLRFTIGKDTTKENIDLVLSKLEKALRA